MILNKLIFFGFLIFVAKCLPTIEAINDVKNGSDVSTEVKQQTKETPSSFSINLESQLATTIGPINTEGEDPIKNNVTFETTTPFREEIITTPKPALRPRFRPSAFYENNRNYKAALVIPQTPQIISTTSTSTAENNVTAVTPNPKNETTPSTPRVLTPEEKCHPIIFEFITRIERVKKSSSAADKTSAPTVHPVDTYFNPRATTNPKLKYFEDFYRTVLNITDITDITKEHRDSSYIRAYYANKNFPTAINYSREDEYLLKNNVTSKRLPFNTKDFYSPKYKEFSRFHYNFFLIHDGPKVSVPRHV